MNQKPPYDPLESLDTLHRAVATEYMHEPIPIMLLAAMTLAEQTLDYYVWTPERILALRNDAELSQVAFAARLGIATFSDLKQALHPKCIASTLCLQAC